MGQVSGWQLAGIVLGLAALPAAAHHSFAAEYDQDKPIKLTGTVTKFDVTNPHSWIYIDVKNADGKLVNWGFETAGKTPSSRGPWSRSKAISPRTARIPATHKR